MNTKEKNEEKEVKEVKEKNLLKRSFIYNCMKIFFFFSIASGFLFTSCFYFIDNLKMKSKSID